MVKYPQGESSHFVTANNKELGHEVSLETLLVLQGNDRGTTYHLSQEIITLGRDSSNIVPLRDREASRFHAEMRWGNARRFLIDLKSSNGLFVNGKRIEEHQLVEGDHIQIGRTLLLYGKRTPLPSSNISITSPSSSFVVNSQPDQSRIVHSMKQEEGEKFFHLSTPQSDDAEWLKKAKSHLNLIYHTTLVVSQTLDIDHLLQRIMELIFEWVQVDRGCVLLYNAEENALIPSVSKFRKESERTTLFSISQTILDYVLRQNEGVLTSDAQTDQRWSTAASIVDLGIREAICVPMQGRYGLVGIIYIDTTRVPKPFARSVAEQMVQENPSLITDFESEQSFREAKTGPLPYSSEPHLTQDHLKLMVTIGHQAALAVEDTRYYRGMVQAERLAAVGQTVALLSHHVKNILQGIRGGSYLIDLGLNQHSEEFIRKGWKIVEKNQTIISDLILDMLTFSKERTPLFVDNDLNRTMGEVIELMKGRCVDQCVDIVWFPNETILPFPFDEGQIHRALTNVILNAIDAVENRLPSKDLIDRTGETLNFLPRVEVQIHHQPQTDSVLIMVDDNGLGILPEERESLFRPFVSKNKSGGTGLGLAVTHKIIQEHQGHIEIEDSPLGGARFIIELPRSPLTRD